MKSASQLRNRIVATALVLSSGAIALSANAAIGAGGGIPDARQITNLANQCKALTVIGKPVTVTASLANLALVMKDTKVTLNGVCDNVPVMDGTTPSNKFMLTFARNIGSATGPVVKDQITYFPPAGDAPAAVSLSVEGLCEWETKKAMEERAIAAGVDVGPLRDRYNKVAEMNCAAIRKAVMTCVAEKGGEGC